jgi:hypothetical protein
VDHDEPVGCSASHGRRLSEGKAQASQGVGVAVEVSVGAGGGVVVPTGMTSSCPTRSWLLSRPLASLMASTVVPYSREMSYRVSPSLTRWMIGVGATGNVGTGVPVGAGVDVSVGTAVKLGVDVGVLVGLGVRLGVAVAALVGVGEELGVGVGVRVGAGV